MNADDAKEMTAAAVRREWPEGKAPFPEYWRGFVETALPLGDVKEGGGGWK